MEGCLKRGTICCIPFSGGMISFIGITGWGCCDKSLAVVPLLEANGSSLVCEVPMLQVGVVADNVFVSSSESFSGKLDGMSEVHFPVFVSCGGSCVYKIMTTLGCVPKRSHGDHPLNRM